MHLISSIWRRLGKLRWLIIWLLRPKYVLGVNALIQNDKGEVWLQQHRFWQDQAWGFPGGLIDANEAPDVALRREILEETGLKSTVGSVVSVERFFRRGLSFLYIVELHDGQLQLDTKEIMAAGYFPLDQLPKPLLPSHLKILKSLKPKV